MKRALSLAAYSGGVDEILQQAATAESLGYDDVWFADVGCPDALTMAAVVARETKNLRVGIGVTPTYTRTPATLAATAATLEMLAPKRIVFGIGTSSHTMIEGWHGLKLERPLKRMRETVELLRLIQSGAKTDYRGETLHSQGYRQPATSTPIVVAALRPKMLELAGEIADGVILNLFPRPALPKIIAHIRAGARRGGRTLDDLEVICRYQIAVSEDREPLYENLRSFVGSYFGVEVYNRYLAWCGYEETAAAIRAAHDSGDRRRAAAEVKDELLEEIAIIGDADYCRDRLAECTAGGIDTHIVTCLSPDAKIAADTYAAFSAEAWSQAEPQAR